MSKRELIATTADGPRRRRILDAARTVFAERGGLSAGLRPIAAEAGCTTGAIYAVFSSKEEIYGALLEESLSDLATRVATAVAREVQADTALRAAGTAFFQYYQENPFEQSLGLYLFERDGRKGLGTAWDERLNARLGETLAIFKACFRRLGAPDTASDPTATRLADSFFAALLGVLSMSAAGRDRSIGTSAETILFTLFEVFIYNTVAEDNDHGN
ncbi:MAG: TetR/AcrR family transcriptional regulator [Pseudomonadota bacterium]